MRDPTQLASARSAYERGDWVTARETYEAAAAVESLAADDLYALGDCAWWMGDVEESNRQWEAAFRLYREDGRDDGAAFSASAIAINHFLRGDDVAGSGWMGRAARLLENTPEGPAHGYMIYVLEVEANWRRSRPGDVLAAARRVREIGRRHNDPALVAASLNGEGRLLVENGQVDEGLTLLDEAMVSVVAGEVSPEWAGNIYCNTIAVCQRLGDLRRMAKWTEATEEWLETMPVAVLFSGICRVHRVQLLGMNGEWDRAEKEAARVVADLIEISAENVAEAWYQIGDLRRLRGDQTGAEEAYRAAHEHGRHPYPGLAILRLRQGDAEAASAAIRSALLATKDQLERARLCLAAVEIEVAVGEVAAAREACDELTEIAGIYASAGLEAMAVTAQGRLGLAESQHDRALPLLRDAYSRWRELDAPYEAARVCLLLARTYQALGDSESARMELETSATVFDRLGAVEDSSEVEALRDEDPRRPGGLTDREVEVLALVASGHTNRQIGEELYISQKTVARHLSNIFAKLGVASRTEAARFAFDNALVNPRPG